MTLDKRRVYLAGSDGMVGRALLRSLQARGYRDVLTVPRARLDLVDRSAVETFFSNERPQVVIVAAAKVGGILANSRFGAEFLYDNLMIAANTIHAAYEHGVEKLIFLGSSCIYPRLAAQPIREEELLTGPLEPTNEPYAIAKIVGLKLCENYYRQYGCNFYSVMPTNLYGPHDNFDLASSHVIPALMRKFHEAKAAGYEHVMVWGTGRPQREFMYVDDVADAIIFLLENVDAATIYKEGVSHINIGCGKDVRISEVAEMLRELTGFEGEIRYDTEKPDGTMRKLLDVSRLSDLGWNYKTPLDDGLQKTYEWFIANPELRDRH